MEKAAIPIEDQRFPGYITISQEEYDQLTNDDIAATRGDIRRLEGKIDNLVDTFEQLGAQFEEAIGGILDGPMGKLMGKLMGKPKEVHDPEALTDKDNIVDVNPDGDGES